MGEKKITPTKAISLHSKHNALTFPSPADVHLKIYLTLYTATVTPWKTG